MSPSLPERENSSNNPCLIKPMLEKGSIFEEKEEVMVSPLGGIPNKRKAYFLKPTVSSLDGPPLELPSLPFSSESEWPLEVSLNGCKHIQRKWTKWEEWVSRMESLHHQAWKAAGIHDAIMSSVLKFHTDKDLIRGLAERWCCDTNTFIFPFGEATVTLEDMMILGGFSVLGDPVSLPLESPELVEIKENLEFQLEGLIRLRDHSHIKWLNFFKDSGKYEHEAFLSLWLSRFVFPDNESGEIGRHVFPIAVNLARGTRLALAPSVLASIYRDLSLLKQAMLITSSSLDEQNNVDVLAVSLWAPLFFVQAWAWERLLPLRPEQAWNCCTMHTTGARIGRWDNVKRSDVTYSVRTAIDSAGESFLWRPYTLSLKGWSVPKFYKEREEKCEGENLEQESESFIRCVRVSELVGLDCREPYRPHRVAMQFGYDQDIPDWIPRSPPSPELTWHDYSRPVDSNLRLYYPSRLSESDVTTRYLKWFPADAFRGSLRGLRSKRRSKVKRFTELYCIPPGFSPKLKQVKVEIECDVLPAYPPTKCQLVENYPDVPPGFPPKCGGVKEKINIANGETNNAVPPGLPTKCGGTKEKMNIGNGDTNYDVPPCFAPKSGGVKEKVNIANGETNYAVPPGFPPKCGGAKEKMNIANGETNHYIPPCFLSKCGGVNKKMKLSNVVSETKASNIVRPDSVEKHIAAKSISTFPGAARGRNESNGVTHNLVINEQDRGERTRCVDMTFPELAEVEARIGTIERLTALLNRNKNRLGKKSDECA